MGRTIANNRRKVGLECRHRLIFRYGIPALGEVAWCFPCNAYRVVVQSTRKLGALGEDDDAGSGMP